MSSSSRSVRTSHRLWSSRRFGSSSRHPTGLNRCGAFLLNARTTSPASDSSPSKGSSQDRTAFRVSCSPPTVVESDHGRSHFRSRVRSPPLSSSLGAVKTSPVPSQAQQTPRSAQGVAAYFLNAPKRIPKRAYPGVYGTPNATRRRTARPVSARQRGHVSSTPSPMRVR